MLRMAKLELLLVLLVIFGSSRAWENGLARTPPMGWMSWMRYACNVDCLNFPGQCIDQQLYRTMIDFIVHDGYLAFGYDNVNIDDCWSEMERDALTKRLVANRTRFPDGIGKLADYAHAKKVKLGIYGDVGTYTCGGYPGTVDAKTGQDYTQIDARTFSDWKVDSLKLDGCYQNQSLYSHTYPEFTKALSQVEHKIVYACSWPAYVQDTINDTDWEVLEKNCNYWRNYDDIEDSWQSVMSIINYYAEHASTIAKFHGPGHWFDADMLLIGNQGLSYEQSRTQMAFWCLWSVPLLMSNDLRSIKPEYKAILQNRQLIQVNQDPWGRMARLVSLEKHTQVWVKDLQPRNDTGTSWAVLYFNNATLGVEAIMSYKLPQIIPDINQTIVYNVLDLFEDKIIDRVKGYGQLTLRVPTSGSVKIVKLIADL